MTPLQGLTRTTRQPTGRLTRLSIEGCSQVRSLAPRLGWNWSTSTSPRFIQEGMEILRAMETLDEIAVGDRTFKPAKFWELYGKGEFKEK